MSDAATLAHIRDEHGIHLTALKPARGGCINEAFQCGDYFLKFNTPDFLPHFEAEAFALREIAATRAVRVPGPVASGASASRSYLVLEYLPLVPLSNKAGETLGYQLVELHRHTSPTAGFPIDNVIGSTPQPNPATEIWSEFWRDHRLGHLFALLKNTGRFHRTDELLGKVDELVPTNPAHSLLHGDLWGGNAAALPDGTPVIFDPASYYGHRETDLAMTRLFGGFPDAFYAAYDEAFPPDEGRDERIELYNLYHILNHVLLFGSSYEAQARHMIGEILG